MNWTWPSSNWTPWRPSKRIWGPSCPPWTRCAVAPTVGFFEPISSPVLTSSSLNCRFSVLRSSISLFLFLPFQRTNFFPQVVLFLFRRSKKVPNSGLGPKWDQSAKIVPKKSRISDSTFRWCWKREAHRSHRPSVIAVPYLDIHNVSCACLWYSLALWYLLTVRYILNWEMSRLRVFLHVFLNFMKIATKVPERSKNGPKKSQFCPKGLNFAFVRIFRVKSQIPYSVLERLPLPSSQWPSWTQCRRTRCHLRVIPCSLWTPHTPPFENLLPLKSFDQFFTKFQNLYQISNFYQI